MELKRVVFFVKIKENLWIIAHTNVYRLSEQINLATTNQMYKWLKGIETPQIETIVKLAKALECPFDYLVGR